MELINLRTLHMRDPVGIDENPYFSWMLQSSRKNVMQEQYRIYVEDLQKQKVWDSGWRTSSDNSFIPYEGEPLKNRTGYHWTVAIKDNCGETAEESAYFETAYPDKSKWKAQWAKSTLPVTKRSSGFGCQPPATLFRKSFKLSEGKKAVQARAYVTARGVYRIYMNGSRIGDLELAPGYSSYDKLLFHLAHADDMYTHHVLTPPSTPRPRCGGLRTAPRSAPALQSLPGPPVWRWRAGCSP